MNELFYEVYKSGRDMVETLRHKDLSEPFQEFVDAIESGSKSLDRSNPAYYKRWKEERNNQQGDTSEVNEDSSNSRHNRSTDGV